MQYLGFLTPCTVGLTCLLSIVVTFMYLCLGIVDTFVPGSVEVRGQFCGDDSLLPMWDPGIGLRAPTWHQGPLSTEPSCWSQCQFFLQHRSLDPHPIFSPKYHMKMVKFTYRS